MTQEVWTQWARTTEGWKGLLARSFDDLSCQTGYWMLQADHYRIISHPSHSKRQFPYSLPPRRILRPDIQSLLEQSTPRSLIWSLTRKSKYIEASSPVSLSLNISRLQEIPLQRSTVFGYRHYWHVQILSYPQFWSLDGGGPGARGAAWMWMAPRKSPMELTPTGPETRGVGVASRLWSPGTGWSTA
jgi:hypothetical protein